MWQDQGDVNYTPCIDLTQGYAALEQQQIHPFEEVLNLVLVVLYIVH
jgi:hypothetical protein